MEKVDTLKDFTKIVVETDEKNPATITNGETVVADGYRIHTKIRLMFFVPWRARSLP